MWTAEIFLNSLLLKYIFFFYRMFLVLIIIVLFGTGANTTASFSVRIVCIPHCHVLSDPNYKISVQLML